MLLCLLHILVLLAWLLGNSLADLTDFWMSVILGPDCATNYIGCTLCAISLEVVYSGYCILVLTTQAELSRARVMISRRLGTEECAGAIRTA
jgi:hypothetical protein